MDPFESLHHLRLYCHEHLLPSVSLSDHSKTLLECVGIIGFFLGGIRSLNRQHRLLIDEPIPKDPRTRIKWSVQQGHLRWLAFVRGGVMMGMGMVGLGAIWVGTRAMARERIPSVWAECLAGAFTGGIVLRGHAAGWIVGGAGGLAVGLLSKLQN